MINDKKIILGVIGSGGRIGRLHTKNIIYNFPNITIKTIQDIETKPLKELANDLSIKNITIDCNDIFNDNEINCVMICSPNPTHVDYIISAANAKKNIFCEKPIDLDPQRINFALDVVEKNGIIFQVGFMKRFDKTFSSMQKMVADGKIGKQYIIKITSRDPYFPPLSYIKTSGGIFLDMSCHDFDLMRYLTGSEVKEIYATGDVLIDPDIRLYNDYDMVVVNVKLANGSLGVIENCRKTNYGYDQRVEMFGSLGSISADNPLVTSISLKSDKTIAIDNQHYWFMERYEDAYIAQFGSFFESVENNKPPLVGGDDGLKAILIGIAAKQSVKEDKPVRM
jgi:myo-inositol 2-dehydrogenase / D-chiro-inositol 1-dehydrogenase